MNVAEEVTRAQQKLTRHVRTTPLQFSKYYSALLDADVYLKLENFQHTGAFKVRGAFNKLLSLTDEERQRGVITASTGNHGAAVAYAGGMLNISTIVFVPENTTETKIETITRLGGDVRFFGNDGGDTEVHARACADERAMVYVSPYNDPHIIGGQGTIGYEIHEQTDALDEIFIAVGGGGLVSGIAGYLKSKWLNLKVTGCLPENSPVMAHSIRAGRIENIPCQSTISDATAGGIEPGAITFDLCRDLVDDWILVSEDEIREGMRGFLDNEHQLLEGSAGVAIAAMLKTDRNRKGNRIAVIICGGNIGMDKLKSVVCA